MQPHTLALSRWVGTIINALVAGGVRDFVVCPGSRSTPLALAVARHPLAQVRVLLDERSAGFFALGLAKQSGTPAALICTSGTAAANFLPAVAEADLARVPLLLLTADRPPELRDNGAPQTIDQVRIFGPRVRWFSDLPTPDDAPALLAYARATAARAIAASLSPPAGPVQLNLPFREPLLPDRAVLAELFAAPLHLQAIQGDAPAELPGPALAEGARRAQGLVTEAQAPAVRVSHGLRLADAPTLQALITRLGTTRRGLILCGPGCPPDFALVVTRLAERLGYPVLADPLSGVRCGPHSQRMVCAAYDAFLRDEGFAAAHVPELVLRFGAMPTAKPLLLYLQRHPTAYQIVVDEAAGWREPTSLAAEHLAADPLWLCPALIDALAADGAAAPGLTLWARPWLSAERLSRQALDQALGRQERLSEPGVFARLEKLLPDGATLFVGNSMPVRDCDTFFPSSARQIQIAGNRGANGIDGLVSTALGMAAAGAKPLAIVLGDLSLYHDANGLLAAKLHGLDATVLLINNDGGGIFSFLPQASEADQFEPLFGTPHGLEFAPLAALYGARYTLATNWATFDAAVAAGLGGRGLHLVEVRTERAQNVADHRELWPLVSRALHEAGLNGK